MLDDGCPGNLAANYSRSTSHIHIWTKLKSSQSKGYESASTINVLLPEKVTLQAWFSDSRGGQNKALAGSQQGSIVRPRLPRGSSHWPRCAAPGTDLPTGRYPGEPAESRSAAPSCRRRWCSHRSEGHLEGQSTLSSLLPLSTRGSTDYPPASNVQLRRASNLMNT